MVGLHVRGLGRHSTTHVIAYLCMVSSALLSAEREDMKFSNPAVHALQERDVVVLPRKPDRNSDSRTARLTVVKTLEFSAQTLRSGIVVLTDDVAPRSALLFLRGAPGPIRDLVDPASVPDNFEEVSPYPSLNSP